MASFIAQLHHRYIIIHPFDDGNGRIVRLWINYVLLYHGYPPLVIKDEDKENYYMALQKADFGNIEALDIYLGKVLISWLKTGIRAAKGRGHKEELAGIDKEVDIYIRNQKRNESSESITLSKNTMLKLCDDFLDPFFAQFEKKFLCFTSICKVSTSAISVDMEKEFKYTVERMDKVYSSIKDRMENVNWEINGVYMKQSCNTLFQGREEYLMKDSNPTAQEESLNFFDVSIEVYLKCEFTDRFITRLK